MALFKAVNQEKWLKGTMAQSTNINPHKWPAGSMALSTIID
jgi:hypothetical protein